MRGLTLRQPHASLVALGVKTIITQPRATAWRGPLLIHAGKARPDGGRTIDIGQRVPAEWEHAAAAAAYPNLPGWLSRGEALRRSTWVGTSMPFACVLFDPLPLGAVVAVADLTDCVPIVGGDGTDATIPDETAVLRTPSDRLWLIDQESRVWHWPNVTDQLPFGDFTPGRYAWQLDNVRPIDPVSEYECPALIDDHCPDPDAGRIDDIGVHLVPVRGRQGLWTPDPQLVEACTATEDDSDG